MNRFKLCLISITLFSLGLQSAAALPNDDGPLTLRQIYNSTNGDRDSVRRFVINLTRNAKTHHGEMIRYGKELCELSPFYNAFQKEIGLPPSKYREKVIELNKRKDKS